MRLVSNFVIVDLSPSSDPRARLLRLQELLYTAVSGVVFLKLNKGVAVPVHKAYINEMGQVVSKEENGFWQLEGHLRWLESQVRRLDNPPMRLEIPKQDDDPQGRLTALQARIKRGEFTMPNGAKMPVDSVYITDEGDLATEFTQGGFWRLVPHMEVLYKMVEKTKGPESQPQKIDLPTDPHQRLTALQARIVTNGQRMFRMPDGELVPVQDVCIGDDNFVDTCRFSGSRTLLGHMGWLEQKPKVVSLGIPGVERPLERYQALWAMIPDDENLDMDGTPVPIDQVWIHNDGRVSVKKFWDAFPLERHLEWLRGKREVESFIQRRDAESRTLLTQAAENAPRVSGVKGMEARGGRTRPQRLQNLGDDRRGW